MGVLESNSFDENPIPGLIKWDGNSFQKFNLKIGNYGVRSCNRDLLQSDIYNFIEIYSFSPNNAIYVLAYIKGSDPNVLFELGNKLRGIRRDREIIQILQGLRSGLGIRQFHYSSDYR